MENKEKWIRWVLTAATVLLLAVLAWQCLDIYITGKGPANLDDKGLHIQSVYRAEDVMDRLEGLRIWIVGYMVLLIGGCVMLPDSSGAGKMLPMEPDNRLRLMKKKIDILPEEAQKEELLRKKVWLICAIFVAVCTIGCLVYLLNRENFTSWDLEVVMGQMLLHTLGWVIAAFGAVMGAVFCCRKSMEREIGILKGIGGSKPVEAATKRSYGNYVRIGLYILAAALVVLGVGNGGMRDVLIKAINICTECIGLG